MKFKIYQIDAFAENIFQGNPAAVVPLESWLPEKLMQQIAFENNLSETAFFVPEKEGFHIRWFTPVAEVNLCGHATLATAHVIFSHLKSSENEICFNSRSGSLKVKIENNLIVLDFPALPATHFEIPEEVAKAFHIQPVDCFKGRDDFMLVFENEEQVKQLKPDFQQLVLAKTRGVICTSTSAKYDFVSRFFAPAVGVNEDPVTGSAHTMLIPYWSEKLGRKELIAKQISARGGILHCKNLGERVAIGGKAVTFLIGEIVI
ncbi:MAG TPA: PhzF family phenazine biosynthesis protein [Draconibacterium sp.]|jgi:PhzF family phenazine biosynthesis protein|nr:PhzF family phenazine biosynthesis protein [Draconibacterium sp.]